MDILLLAYVKYKSKPLLIHFIIIITIITIIIIIIIIIIITIIYYLSKCESPMVNTHRSQYIRLTLFYFSIDILYASGYGEKFSIIKSKALTFCLRV